MRAGVRITLAGAQLTLLLLSLPRWVTSHGLLLERLPTAVTLAALLGAGVGLLRSTRTTRRAAYGPTVLAVLVLALTSLPLPSVRVMVPLVALAGAMAMAGYAEFAGRVLHETGGRSSRPRRPAVLTTTGALVLLALGALGGVLLDMLLTFAGVPPVGWAVLLAVGSAILWPRPGLPIGLVVVLALPPLVLGVRGMTLGATWSPYGLVTERTPLDGQTTVRRDGLPLPAPRAVTELARDEPTSLAPFDWVPGGHPRRVLVLGAGTGNDTALALARGAEHVDAVEVDPALVDVGARRHPDHPYADSRVSVHVADARAFLNGATGRWDLIIFTPEVARLGLPGTNTPGSSYALTTQALARARTLLAPNGAVAVIYEGAGWAVRRLELTVGLAIGGACTLHGERTTTLVAPSAGMARTAPTVPLESRQCAGITAMLNEVYDVPITDDQAALSRHGWPWSTETVAALLGFAVAVLLVAVVLGGRRGVRRQPRLAGLGTGAAAWLVGLWALSAASLRFGSTWNVRCVVLALLLLGAILLIAVGGPVARRLGRRLPPADPARTIGLAVLGALLGALVGYAVPVLGSPVLFGALAVAVVVAAGSKLLALRRAGRTALPSADQPQQAPAQQDPAQQDPARSDHPGSGPRPADPTDPTDPADLTDEPAPAGVARSDEPSSGPEGPPGSPR
ncbi:spermidine synthase [Actinopolymorpha pittospori]